jgi:hypothetical protein
MRPVPFSAITRIVLGVALGLLAPLVLILGAEPFEGLGPESRLALASGCLAVALYCAACQYWLARRTPRSTTANWPNVGGMVLAVAGTFLAIAAGEGGGQWRTMVPAAVAGFIGAALGLRLSLRTSGANAA